MASGTAAPQPEVRVWAGPVPGVREVLHARFPDHSYPLHTHDTWTLLTVDRGAVRYDLDRHEHVTDRQAVTLLPPHVPHDGRPATDDGFVKRVAYLEGEALDARLLGRGVDLPDHADPDLRRWLDGFHRAATSPGEELETETWLALALERLAVRLATTGPARPSTGGRDEARIARAVRDQLDARVVEGASLAEVSSTVAVSPAHAARSFARQVGMPPHRYLTSRRVDLARRLLLEGMAPAEVAVSAGFHDQPHLNRHFRRLLGSTPGAYARAVRD